MSKLPPAFARHLKPVRQAAPKAAPRQDGALETLRRAREHRERGELGQAEKLCISILVREPGNVEALLLAGLLARDVEDPGLAIVLFKRAVASKPSSIDARLALAAACEEAQEYDEAIGQLRRVLSIKADAVPALVALGRCYTHAGKAESSLPCFEKARSLAAEHPTVRIDHAAALISLGRMDEAADLLRASIAKGFGIGSSYRSLADTRKFSGNPAELGSIMEELAKPKLNANDKVHLHHAAGKILNDIGRYEDAVDHFQAGKDAGGVDFDIDAFRRRVDTRIASFTPSLLKSKAGLGSPSDIPVFIVGMPRSGTTLVEQICASHPGVYGAGELNRLGTVIRTDGYAEAPNGAIQKTPGALTADEARSMAANYLDFVRRPAPTAARVVDKMPHNFLYVGMIALIFPNARIIHCTRDAIDNCISCFFNSFNDKHGYNANLETLGLYYREYERLMRHWSALLPGRIYQCSYEAMISDQEAETRRLIEFLGLTWDDACLRFYETQRSVTTPSRWQVRQPIYKSSVKRWKNYGDKVKPLVEALGDLADV